MTRPRYPSDAKTYDRGTVETKLRLSPEGRRLLERQAKRRGATLSGHVEYLIEQWEERGR